MHACKDRGKLVILDAPVFPSLSLSVSRYRKNWMINLDEKSLLHIKRGTPLIHQFPLTNPAYLFPF